VPCWLRWGRPTCILVAPNADVYHGHDFSAVGAALRARRRHGVGKVIYDSHEVYLEAGTFGKRSPALKWLLSALRASRVQPRLTRS
jgi:hypothetical protein